jgi:hypothetical protein
MEIELSVEQKDIDSGTRNSSVACPIARALGRALCEQNIPFQGISVGPDECAVFPDGDRDVKFQRAGLPKIATAFIYLFDQGAKVEPITFSLELSPVGD